MMIKTIPATIQLRDGSVKEVRVIEYSLPCGSIGHSMTLKTGKPVWEIHVKNCRICREEYGYGEVPTNGNNNGARSLIYLH